MLKFEELESLIEQEFESAVNLRRRIHQEPELGGQELKTAHKVQEYLHGLPIDVQSGVNGHGIIATIQGAESGKTLMFRGDMDALPIHEDNELEFKSTIPNVMHACGHDVHTTLLAACARVLCKVQGQLKGNVKFMFQPAEECAPEGGAKGMIAAGVLENPKVDEAYALHVTDLPIGQITFRPGVANSTSDNLYIDVYGKSSHGSQPHEGYDAIVAAGNIIGAVQTVVSRNLPLSERAVVTIGTIEGGTALNIVADKVHMTGTVRAFSSKAVEIVKERLKAVVENTAAAYGCRAEMRYEDGYDFIYNDLQLSEDIKSSIGELLGAENIIIQPEALPAGEDFSFVSKRVPSVFLWLGARDANRPQDCIIHNPRFMIDEAAIREGLRIMCKLVYDKLIK